MLRKIFDKYDTDKGRKHNYDKIYEPYFEKKKDDPINFLEIGIFKGKSMEALLEYFPNATIYGMDIFTRVDEKTLDVLTNPRVKWLKIDSTSFEVGARIKKEWGDIKFDFVIDDGMHTPDSNMWTFKNIVPFLKDDGVYFIEDVFPFDKYTIEESNHEWIKEHSSELNYFKFDVFMRALDEYNIKRFDHRKMNKTPDSHIIAVSK